MGHIHKHEPSMLLNPAMHAWTSSKIIPLSLQCHGRQNMCTTPSTHNHRHRGRPIASQITATRGLKSGLVSTSRTASDHVSALHRFL